MTENDFGIVNSGIQVERSTYLRHRFRVMHGGEEDINVWLSYLTRLRSFERFLSAYRDQMDREARGLRRRIQTLVVTAHPAQLNENVFRDVLSDIVDVDREAQIEQLLAVQSQVSANSVSLGSQHRQTTRSQIIKEETRAADEAVEAQLNAMDYRRNANDALQSYYQDMKHMIEKESIKEDCPVSALLTAQCGSQPVRNTSSLPLKIVLLSPARKTCVHAQTKGLLGRKVLGHSLFRFRKPQSLQRLSCGNAGEIYGGGSERRQWILAQVPALSRANARQPGHGEPTHRAVGSSARGIEARWVASFLSLQERSGEHERGGTRSR